MKRYIPVLTIAGSDCSGGAGLQADIKTISALGCYAASVVTAVTVQNTLGVILTETVKPDIVSMQISAVMDDIQPQVVKIGMVTDKDTINAIACTLRLYPDTVVVLDPVMTSSSGDVLLRRDALEAFKDELLPLASLTTPNLPEAEVLSGIRIIDEETCDEAGKAISGNVLIKGGHRVSSVKQDRLYDANGTLVATYEAPTVDTCNTHGTGCTLAAAIACYMAMDEKSMDEAIGKAKTYLTQALRSGADVKTGRGSGPLNHFFNPTPLIKR